MRFPRALFTILLSSAPQPRERLGISAGKRPGDLQLYSDFVKWTRSIDGGRGVEIRFHIFEIPLLLRARHLFNKIRMTTLNAFLIPNLTEFMLCYF